MPIVYDTDITKALVAESAREFGSTYELHLADIVLGIAAGDWDGSWSLGGGIDLEELIWELNERHDRKDDRIFSISEAEQEAFTAVMRQLYTPEIVQSLMGSN